MKTLLAVISTLLIYTLPVRAQNSSPYFITQWNTSLDTTNDGTFIQFAGRGRNYTVLVSGLDTSYSSSLTANGLINIPVPKAGSYTVIAYGGEGTFEGYSNHGGGSGTPQTDPRDALTRVIQWGNTKFQMLNFNSSDNLDITATDKPDLSKITDLQEAFAYCPSLKANNIIEKWDVSNVTIMYKMFLGDAKFNRDLGGWNLSSAVNLGQMFSFTGMTSCNYTKTLNGWAANPNTARQVFFGSQDQMKFTDSTGRNKLIANLWTINGDIYTTSGGCQATTLQPFKFSNPGGSVSNGQLTVTWSTLSEDSADHFEIEASSDSATFRSIGTVNSQAVDGHSDKSLTYTFTTSYDRVIQLIAGFGFLGLLIAPTSARKRRYDPLIPVLLYLACLTTAIACKKSSGAGAPVPNKKIYIRIAGVDKNGEKTYSEIFHLSC